MSDLSTDVRYIKGIGEARAKALSKLEIRTLYDLISYFPRTWEDRSALYTIDTPWARRAASGPWWPRRRRPPTSAKGWTC